MVGGIMSLHSEPPSHYWDEVKRFRAMNPFKRFLVKFINTFLDILDDIYANWFI